MLRGGSWKNDRDNVPFDLADEDGVVWHAKRDFEGVTIHVDRMEPRNYAKYANPAGGEAGVFDRLFACFACFAVCSS